MALPVFSVDIQMDFGAGWVTVSADVVVDSGAPCRWRRGMSDNGPETLVAAPGTLEFTLRNDAKNSGTKQGYYSPLHANCRSGFAEGIPVRVIATYLAVVYPLWRGRLRTIDPAPGTYRTQRTACFATDYFADLVDADLRAVTMQISQTEVQLLQTIVAALPTAAQPPSTSYDAALDTYPAAFDNIASGVKAASLVGDVMKTARGYYYPLADGTAHYENRHARPLKASSFTFTDLKLHGQGIVVPTDLSLIFNRVRGTFSPRTTDAAATTELFAISQPIYIAGGETKTIWGTYRDANNVLKMIGGTAFVAPVATTDYTANTSSDGSGADKTSATSVAATQFATTVKFVVTNTGTTGFYLTTCRQRGKGIYDNAPVTLESYTAQSYGDRPLDLDLPYAYDSEVVQDLIDFVKASYMSLTNQVAAIEFDAYQTAALLVQGLTREIGDVITASETVTGFNAEAAIQGIEMEYRRGPWLRTRFITAPDVVTTQFIFDDAVNGVLDTSPFAYA